MKSQKYKLSLIKCRFFRKGDTLSWNEEDGVEMLDAELTTSRGEFKVRTVSFSEDGKGQVGC